MINRWVTYTAFAVVLLACMVSAGNVWAAAFPGASGMAVLDDSHMLIVQDVKIGQDGSALGVLELLPDGGFGYAPLTVDWPERPANDLESCCALGDRPGEFLAAESGSYHEVWYDPESTLYRGRIFHLRVEAVEGGWQAEVLNTIPIPLDLHEVEGMVAIPEDEASELALKLGGTHHGISSGIKHYDYEYRTETRLGRAGTAEDNEQVDSVVSEEGAQYWVPVRLTETTGDEQLNYVFVLATRGGGTAYEQARLHWGTADLKRGAFRHDKTNSLPLYCSAGTPGAWERGCSDMYLDEAGVIWVATARDEGDAGPFGSTVYRFGELAAVLQSSSLWLPAYSMLNAGVPPVIWNIEGVKIEALGAGMIDGAVLSYATDDEGYGGIWRPLGEAR